MATIAVTAIERVLDIFETFQARGRPLSLTELAEQAGIPKSSCHAIVGTLTARGYLYTLSRPRALYPTRRFYDVAHEIQRHDPFIQRALASLEQLRDATGETVILGKRQGDSVLYLEVLEGVHAIRYSARPGEFKPLHSSSIGKALVGSLKEAKMREQVTARAAARGLSAITERTLTEPEALMQDLLESRRRGYFLTRGENVPDVWAVSAFLTLRTETLAIAVAGPRHRMELHLEECARQLVAICSRLALASRSADLESPPHGS